MEIICKVDNIKLGGSCIHDFVFQNNDALDIGKVLFENDYTVVDVTR